MKQRKILSVMLVTVMTVCLLNGFQLSMSKVKAEVLTGNCGTNLQWSLDTGTGVLTITGSGAMENYTYNNYAPWYENRTLITSVELPNGISRIGSYAFYGCSNLAEVEIPDSVRSIQYDAFLQCSSLTEITIPENVTTLSSGIFAGCSSLAEVDIQGNITAIGGSAFNACSSLTEIDIPESVTSIGAGAFSLCSSLTSVTIPDSVTTLGNQAFNRCSNLAEVNISNSITIIGYQTFERCSSLTSVTIPDSVITVDKNAFYNCTGLTEIILPANVSTLGEDAFYNCSSMTDIYIYNTECNIYNRSAIPYGATIHGYEDSTAEIFAETYNRTFVAFVTPEGEFTTVPGYIKTVAGGSSGEAQNPPDGAVVEQGVWRLWDMNADTSSGSQVNYNGAISYMGSGRTYQKLTLRIDEPVVFKGGYDGANPIGIATTFQLSNNTVYEYTVKYTSTNAGGAAIHMGAHNASSVHRNPTVYHQVEAGENVLKGFIRISHQNDGTEGAVKFCFYPSDGQTALPAGTQIRFTEISFKPLSEISSNVLTGQIGNNMHWSLDRTTGAMEISGTGRHSFTAFGAPWYFINGLIRSVTFSGGITSITNCAFNECSKIESVTIPDSITKIECNAFYGCGSLTSITVPESVSIIEWRGIYGCSSLTDVYIYNRNCNINNNVNTIDSQVTIHGYTGSTAETYATAYSRTFIPLEEPTTEEPTIEESTTEEPTTVEPTTVEPTTEEPTTKEPVTEKPTTEPVTEDSEPEADFKIASKTLALSSGISLVFKVNKSLFENRYSEPKVVVLLDGIETEITEYKDEGSRYAFEFTKITPDKMNIMVEATLHASKNGKEYVSPVVEYSVATYAYNMLNKYGETAGMETFRTLLVDLLNYGAASQNYTGFNTDNLANTDLTATQRNWASGDLGELTSVKNNKYVTIDNPSVLWKSAGLALQDAVIVRMKIQADSTDGLVVQVRDDYGTTWNIEPEDFALAQGTVNQYYVDFKGFNVGRMSESMYFTVLRNGVAVSNTYRYSVESYVLQYMNNDGPLGALVVAMMKYGKSAQAYSS